MQEYDRFLQAELVPDPIVIMSDTNGVIRPLKMNSALSIIGEPKGSNAIR